jgi:hypothetical protein
MPEKHQYFNGVKFTRDEKTGYYLNSNSRQRIHRYVWQFHNGNIPEGFQVHHKDENKSNNDISNLELLPKSKHMSHHMTKRVAENPADFQQRMDNARIYASEWHGSADGIEWHKKHYAEVKDALHVKKEFTCKNCDKLFVSVREGFCSNACKSAWRRKQGVDNETKECKQCGKEFTTNKYSKAETCSQSCTNRYRFHKAHRETGYLQHGSQAI